jgi:hypothetical protein
MATFSKKLMGKEVGDASVYAQPHNMKGQAVQASSNPGSGPNQSNASTVNMSVGAVTRRDQPGTKTSGIKVRGTGAATKGVMARGPMA